jgi:hypothetical protein
VDGGAGVQLELSGPKQLDLVEGGYELAAGDQFLKR